MNISRHWIYRLANNPWVVVALFLLSVFDYVGRMLGIVDSLQVEASSMWIDILVKAALCAIILLLQHKVKMLEKYVELRRTVDGIINARLARIVYQKDWKFTTAEAETDYMRQHFAEEKEDVRRILSDSAKHLSGKQVDDLMSEYYGED